MVVTVRVCSVQTCAILGKVAGPLPSYVWATICQHCLSWAPLGLH